jgi:hypothetical protein
MRLRQLLSLWKGRYDDRKPPSPGAIGRRSFVRGEGRTQGGSCSLRRIREATMERQVEAKARTETMMPSEAEGETREGS